MTRKTTLWKSIFTILVLFGTAHQSFPRHSGDGELAVALPLLQTRLQIEVTDGTTKIKNVRLIIKSLEPGAKFNREIKTNINGVAVVSRVPDGLIKVTVIARGYQTYGYLYKIPQEKQITISLTKSR